MTRASTAAATIVTGTGPLCQTHPRDPLPLVDPSSELAPFVSSLWSRRTDRYSEERGQEHAAKAEMSYLGG